MEKRRIKKINFYFGGRNKLKDSNWSIVFSIFSIVIFLFSSIYSGVNEGEAGLLVGVLGLIAIVINIYGFYMAVKSLRGDDIYFFTALMGVVLNGLMLSTYIVLIIVGFLV